MPTLIDSLIVELSLDPRRFTQGQRDALAQFKKTSEEAVRRSNDMEEAARRQQNLFSKVRREAIGLFAAVAGGYGIKQLVSSLVTGDAAMGRFKRSTGLATEEISTFEAAVSLAGGAIGAGKDALGTLQAQIVEFNRGNNPQLIATYNQLSRESGVFINQQATILEQMKQIGEAARIIEAKHPGRGAAYLRDLGLNPDAISFLVKGRAEIGRLIEEGRKLGAATDANTEAAEKLLGKWRETGQIITGLIRPLEEVASDTLDKINAVLGKAKKNQETFYGAGEDRTALGNARVNTLIGVTPERQKEAQDWFANSWLGRLLGVKPDTGPPAPSRGRSGFGGMSTVIGNPQFPSPATYGAGMRQPVGSSTSSSEINVNGPINIVTAATDAAGLARDLKAGLEALGSRRLAAQANGGAQ